MRVSAAGDFDGSFGDVKMGGEELNQGGVGLTIVGLGAKVNGELTRGGFDDLLARGAGFDFDLIGRHTTHYSIREREASRQHKNGPRLSAGLARLA